MNFQISPFAIITAIGCSMALMVALISYNQEPKGQKFLTAMMLGAAVWTGGAAFENSFPLLSTKIFWANIQFLGGLSIPVSFLLLSLQYAGLDRWISKKEIFLLSIIPGITALLVFTNTFHHLIWRNAWIIVYGTTQVLTFDHGFWYWIGVVFFPYVYLFVGTILFIYSAMLQPPAYRGQVILIVSATLFPWFVNLMYVAGFSLMPGFEFTPLALVVSGALWDWALVEGMRAKILEKSLSLEDTVSELRREIEKRTQLENDLKDSQVVMSNRLSMQSSKLSGLYDLILVEPDDATQVDLLPFVLGKINQVLGSSRMIYFRLEKDLLHFESSGGLQPEEGLLPSPFDGDWLPDTGEVRAVLSIRQAPDLPLEVLFPENYAALFKWVSIHGQPTGILASYWSPGYQLSVDDITLFSAVTNLLGLILENDRLRRSAANTAIVQERRRLARDLHDSVTQSLHSLVLTSQTAMEDRQDSKRLGRTLKRLEVSAQQSLKEMRLLLYELRLVSLEEINLLEALNTRLDAVERHAGIKAEIIVAPNAAWQREWETQLYPIAMEALNNSLKHARATAVTVRFLGDPTHFKMEVEDNGMGFDAESLFNGGVGLKSMSERSEVIRGSLQVISTPSQGTLVRLEIPHSTQPVVS